MRIRWPVVIMLAVVALGGVVVLNILSQPAVPIAALGTSPTAGPDTFCTNAVPAVQQYKAPGNRNTVGETVTAALRTEPGGARMDGWEPAERVPVTDLCWVTLRATVGNEPRRFEWQYEPKTGAVSARDDATKRLSGW